LLFVNRTELNHEQSREIEQDSARSSSNHNRHHHHHPNLDSVQRVARRAADEVNRFTTAIYQTAVPTYQQQQQQ
jgi:hypothetical protein